MMQPNRGARTTRPGFTLVELLVVVAILSVLAALTTAAVMRFMGTQPARNTKVLLDKLNGTLQSRWSESTKAAQNSSPPDTVTQAAGGDKARAQVIWTKLQMKREFPMSYAEALQPWSGLETTFGLSSGNFEALPAFRKALAGKRSINPLTESAACLLISLQITRQGQTFNAEEALGAGAIKDSDGDGVPEIVDGWGRPIAFFRWPTGNPTLDAMNTAVAPSSQARDNGDPTGKLMDSAWNTATNPAVTAFEQALHPISAGTPRQPRSFYTMPTIMSFGADGKPGVDIRMTPQGNEAADNLYSFKIK